MWSVTQLCLTLWDLLDCIPPDSSVHGIFQARLPEWVANSLQGTFPTQGSNPRISCLLLYRRILYMLSHQGSPQKR